MGLSIFNAVGASLGGVIGNLVVGSLVTKMGSFVQAMVFMGVFLLAGGLMMLGLWAWEHWHNKALARSSTVGC